MTGLAILFIGMMIFAIIIGAIVFIQDRREKLHKSKS